MKLEKLLNQENLVFSWRNRKGYVTLLYNCKTIFQMTISKDKNRREVHLTKEVLDILQKQADEEGRSLKNLMEIILIRYAKQQPI